MSIKEQFSFKISLSVLNHLGRHLYRSFTTVLGEAISNAWDADAKNVWIYVDKNNFFIKDDGIGMSAYDFQHKLLKIGHTKRTDGSLSPNGRPFIGRKGIGKLALLSCAEKIAIISKTSGKDYVGGLIDNSQLDSAIEKDLSSEEYPLENLNLEIFAPHLKDHDHGTIIYFEDIKDGIKNSLDFLRKTIALYFKFSLIDESFNIYLNNKKITFDDLADLINKTEFTWKINDQEDPYIEAICKKVLEQSQINTKLNISGFIASVEKPKHLNIITTDERVTVDLFVNGRLREKDILKHIPSSRIVENYLYGQIHFNELDDKIDRFTSSREGVIADDPKYKNFLNILREEVMKIITSQWDKWRLNHHKDGDSENLRIPKKERKSKELFNTVVEDYIPPKGSKNKKSIDGWINNLSEEAQYNYSSYAECFVSENLLRTHIQENEIIITPQAQAEISTRKKSEKDSKDRGNISIEIRKVNCDLNYLSMSHLANMIDKKDLVSDACLSRDANEYKPMRDAVAHTSLLSPEAKLKLTSVYDNIKGRIKTLLSD